MVHLIPYSPSVFEFINVLTFEIIFSNVNSFFIVLGKGGIVIVYKLLSLTV